MAEQGNTPEDPLEVETAFRRRDQAPGVRDPVGVDADAVEAAATAERPELAARQEVVRGPVALRRPELEGAIDATILPGESRDPAQIVVRLDEVETAPRSDDPPELDEDLRASVEMVQALDDERRVDRRGRHVAVEVERRGADDLDVVQPFGVAPSADHVLHVDDWLDGDHRARAARDQRREVAAARPDLQGPAVVAHAPRARPRAPDLLDQEARRVLVLGVSLVAVDPVVLFRAFPGIGALVEPAVDAVEPGA